MTTGPGAGAANASAGRGWRPENGEAPEATERFAPASGASTIPGGQPPVSEGLVCYSSKAPMSVGEVRVLPRMSIEAQFVSPVFTSGDVELMLRS